MSGAFVALSVGLCDVHIVRLRASLGRALAALILLCPLLREIYFVYFKLAQYAL